MMGERPIRVLVADDHAVVREGLCALINAWSELEVVSEAGDGIEAVHKARQLRPDVVLMDLVMPRMGGVEATTEIIRDNANIGILVLSSFSDDEQIAQAIEAGATGYLLKEVSSRDLIQAIFDVHHGKLSLHPTITRKLLQRLGRPRDPTQATQVLSPREIDVLKLVAKGLSNQDIAQALCISEWTVAKHVSGILGRLELENRTQAALYALRSKLVELE